MTGDATGNAREASSAPGVADLEMTLDLSTHRQLVEAVAAERPQIPPVGPDGPGYHLRPLAWADITRVAALEVALFGASAWTMGMLTEELRGQGRWYVAAQPDGDGVPAPLIGYAGLWFDGDDAHLMTIGVAPESQGRGVGKAMLTALVDRAREIGARSLILEVAVDNEVAINMYRSRGFAQIGLRKRYYQPEDVDAYTMQLVLDPVVVPPHEGDPEVTSDGEPVGSAARETTSPGDSV